MTRILTIYFFCLSTSILFGQQNSISVDSLKKMLAGSWTAIVVECKNMRSDSVTREITFSKNIFTLIELQGGIQVSKVTGTYKIDSVNTSGYNMTVTLDKEFIKPKYNSYLLNMRVFDTDKILVSWFEVFYYKDEQKYIHYPGDYRFYKTD